MLYVSASSSCPFLVLLPSDSTSFAAGGADTISAPGHPIDESHFSYDCVRLSVPPPSTFLSDVDVSSPTE
jgi:hypothetical protein